MDALLKEIVLRKNYAEGEEIKTIYFGGGTPSLLAPDEIALIMDQLAKNFKIDSSAEITLEANPDDIIAHNTPMLKDLSTTIESTGNTNTYDAHGIMSKAAAWKKEGINRLSIGIQSFFEKDLQWMNRAHSATQATRCIEVAQQAGISDISIDLIFGTPGLSDERWLTNLNMAVSHKVPHLSCYALTVEPGTALDHMTKKKRTDNVNADDQARQFLLMIDFLNNKGYDHYEISNFALPGKKSRHNSSYWTGAKYIGLGPSAHSFNGWSRQWNIANNALYIQALKSGQLSFDIETLTPKQQFNEYVMTSLRTMEGLDISYVRDRFGKEYAALLTGTIQPMIDKNWIKNINGNMTLTREGKLFADGIASELFIDQ